MILPTIGDTITTDRARELAVALDLPHVVALIDAEPEAFKEWVFDGVSILDDHLAGALTGIEDRVTAIALVHDLQYAYGRMGDEKARARADTRFRADLLAAGANAVMSELFYLAVHLGGAGSIRRTSYTWGFARRGHE